MFDFFSFLSLNVSSKKKWFNGSSSFRVCEKRKNYRVMGSSGSMVGRGNSDDIDGKTSDWESLLLSSELYRLKLSPTTEKWKKIIWHIIISIMVRTSTHRKGKCIARSLVCEDIVQSFCPAGPPCNHHINIDDDSR